MGGMMGGGGKGGGGGGGKGGGGISGADMAMIEQALGMNIQEMQARYKQLGLGVPSGDPAQAAASGTSLQYAGPGTAEQTDIRGLQNMAGAALGQLQNNNMSNPAVPGSPANIQQGNTQLAQLAGQAQQGQGNADFGAGFNAGA